jgi:hypothetical protein
VAITILEEARWTDSDELQEYWANLLVNAMTPNGGDDESLVYAPILAGLNSVQVRVLSELCEVTRTASRDGWKFPERTMQQWMKLSGAKNIDEFGSAMQSMAVTGLISFNGESNYCTLPDENFGLNFQRFGMVFFARINGHTGDLNEFFNRPA